jgi:hypothetical protein
LRHPERSRSSGEERDLARIAVAVETMLHHYPTTAVRFTRT